MPYFCTRFRTGKAPHRRDGEQIREIFEEMAIDEKVRQESITSK